MKKSIILNAFFPNAINSINDMLNAIRVITQTGISTIEFYYEGKNKEILKNYLQENSINSIYLGALALKTKGLNLSSVDECLREKSVEELKKSIKDAYYFGSEAILINSGTKPEDKLKERNAIDSFIRSLEELILYSKENFDVNRVLNFYLEPGGISNEYSYELIGSTNLAIQVTEVIRKKYNNFYLTIDTSHLIQLNEDVLYSIKKAYNLCQHIHLANCIINDYNSDLYGDKHPSFNERKGELDVNKINKIYKNICNIFKNRELLIGIEVICREDNKIKYFTDFVSKNKWFFDLD